MSSTAYVTLTGFTHGGPPADNGILCWQAIVLDEDGDQVRSPDYGIPASETYQIQGGDTNASIAAAITGQVQAEWGDDTLTVTFIAPA